MWLHVFFSCSLTNITTTFFFSWNIYQPFSSLIVESAIMIPTFSRSGNRLSPSLYSSFIFYFFLHALVKELLWQRQLRSPCDPSSVSDCSLGSESDSTLHLIATCAFRLLWEMQIFSTSEFIVSFLLSPSPIQN